MMTILFTMNLLISLTFIMMNHPLSVGLILLLQTTIISIITGNFNSNFWFSYILFLILIGGMLILFMYMTSIASNEKFKLNPKIILISLLYPPLHIMISQKIKSNITNNEINMFYKNETLQLSLNKFVNFPLSMTLIFMMMYLFLALVATVKITEFKSGSIRQMN